MSPEFHLNYFGEKLGSARSYLVTLRDDRDWEDRRTGIRILPAAKFLMGLI